MSIFTEIRDIWQAIERWVHRQNKIVSSISHFVICTGVIVIFGLPPSALLANVIPAALIASGMAFLYGYREQHAVTVKGFDDAARDGDTLFGPDFMLAVAGCVAGFTIVYEIVF